MPSNFIRLYGVINLIVGVMIYAAAFGEKHAVSILPAFSPAFFIFAVITFIPFVVTYTRCGLNYPEDCPLGEKSTLEHDRLVKQSDANHARLREKHPFWKYTYNGIMALCLGSWIVFGICDMTKTPMIVNPFLSFLASLFLLSGAWFTFTYEGAKELNPK